MSSRGWSSAFFAVCRLVACKSAFGLGSRTSRLACRLSTRWHIDLAVGRRPLAHYLPMLRQQGQLWLNQPELRRLALVAACFFAALNGIWANLASLAHATLHWSSGQTGLLAFTAIVALGAPAMVRWLQNHCHWSGVIVLLGTGVVAVSLAGCWLGSQLPMIIAFLIMSDVSVRSIQVITQGRVLI